MLERRPDQCQELYLKGDSAKPAYLLQERETIDSRLLVIPDAPSIDATQTRSKINTFAETALLWRQAQPHLQHLIAPQTFASMAVDSGAIASTVPQPVYRLFYAKNLAPDGTGLYIC